MSLPAPLVAAEIDLRDFQYMELDVQLLRDSKFAAEVDGEAFRAGVLLWCASWHQVPAGSLPDNDIELSNLAGFGRVVKEWRKVRDQALMLFVRCSDGRLYHPVIAEKAAAAWDSRLHHQHGKLLERMRKENKKREGEKLQPLPFPTFDQWNSDRLEAGKMAESVKASGGIPAENALRGNGEGTERERNGDSLLSEAIASGGKPPADPPMPAIDPAEAIFALGLPLLLAAAVPEKNARSFLGFLRKQAKTKGGDKAVVDAINRCMEAHALQPVEFLQGCFKTAKPEDEAARRAESDAETKRLLGFNTQEIVDA